MNIDEEVVSMDVKKVNELMSKFVQEVKKKDGIEYPPSTLTEIVLAIQRCLRENSRPTVSFFNERNATYDLLRKSLYANMKLLTRKGIGVPKKQAQTISPEIW